MYIYVNNVICIYTVAGLASLFFFRLFFFSLRFLATSSPSNTFCSQFSKPSHAKKKKTCHQKKDQIHENKEVKIKKQQKQKKEEENRTKKKDKNFSGKVLTERE